MRFVIFDLEAQHCPYLAFCVVTDFGDAPDLKTLWAIRFDDVVIYITLNWILNMMQAVLILDAYMSRSGLYFPLRAHSGTW